MRIAYDIIKQYWGKNVHMSSASSQNPSSSSSTVGRGETGKKSSEGDMIHTRMDIETEKMELVIIDDETGQDIPILRTALQLKGCEVEGWNQSESVPPPPSPFLFPRPSLLIPS